MCIPEIASWCECLLPSDPQTVTNLWRSVSVCQRNAAVLHVHVWAMTCAALHVNSAEIHLRVNPLRAILVQA